MPHARAGDPLHHLDYRLAYSETDPAGIVYFGAYHPWMERTYTDWTATVGLRTDLLEAERGFTTHARHSSVRYDRPARVYASMRCELRLGAIGTTSYTLRFDFVDRDDDGHYAVGTFTLVTARDGRPIPVPDDLRRALTSAGPPVGTD